jgi:holo-[acyl-carrier protein] synthase
MTALQNLTIAQPRAERLRVGMDVVDIRRVSESIERFGDRFVQRLFSEGELAYALNGEGQAAQRLAARFAAKEAAIKAFNLTEVGVNWRDIEVQKQPDGACRLALHGRAASQAERLGVCEIALSMSHDGDYAAAVVTALVAPASSADSTFPRGIP